MFSYLLGRERVSPLDYHHLLLRRLSTVRLRIFTVVSSRVLGFLGLDGTKLGECGINCHRRRVTGLNAAVVSVELNYISALVDEPDQEGQGRRSSTIAGYY
jgi:hypothetical protein